MGREREDKEWVRDGLETTRQIKDDRWGMGRRRAWESYSKS